MLDHHSRPEAHVLGVTGSWCGKIFLIDKLIIHLEKKTAYHAVDPSSNSEDT